MALRIFLGLLLPFVAGSLSWGGVASFRYFRFTPTKLRNGAAANSVQMSELRLYRDGVQLTGAVASNPGGNNPGGEEPANLVDNNTSTKWLDFNRGPAILRYPATVSVDSYRWATANDATERDPIRWTLEGSSDGANWVLMDDRNDVDQVVTRSRRALLPVLGLNQFPDTPQIVFSASDASGITSSEAVGISPGQAVTLSWEVTGAQTVTLNGSPVENPGQVVVSPTNRTDYLLTAGNAFGGVSETITVHVVESVSPPFINEFSAAQSRDGALLDLDGDPSDWIELYNPNPFAVDFGGYGLVDDPFAAPEVLPEGTVVAAGGYLIVFASGKAPVPGELRISFGLASEGDYLALRGRDGFTVLQEFAPGYPPQQEDVSYGWTGATFDYFTGPTPGAINDTPPGPLAGEVEFVTPPQTFTASLSVSLATTEPEGVIRYTTDGGLPDENSSVFSGPIVLTRSSMVRARVYAPGKAPGKIKAAGYFQLETAARRVSSNLPIIVIDNFSGGAVPNNVDLQPAFLKLFEPDPLTGRTSLSDLPTKSNRMGIKRRGSSTLNDPKGNYRIEFWRDDSEEDRGVNLLGLSDHDEWILFAPYRFDRSLLRIPFIHGLSNDIGTYASRSRFVEVYLNTDGEVTTGDYQGVYVLQERISRDGERVDVEPLDPWDLAGSAVTGGYILSIDRLDPGDRGFRSALGHPFDPPNGSPQPWFTYVYPKEQNILPAQAAYIRGYIDDLEAALYGPDFRDPELGYRVWLDVPQSIDHHLLTTFTKDPDGLRLSTYLHKPRNGKLAFGPIWDFDRTMGNDSDGRSADPQGWNPAPERAEFFDYDYWGRLFDDPDFFQEWIDRWQEVRRGPFANQALLERLDDLAAEVSEAQVRNAARWPEVAPNGGAFSSLGGWPGEVEHLKEWVKRRAEWIDTQFVSPPQLQESSLVMRGESVSMSAPEGTLYFTVDGSDPRLPGGAVSPLARASFGDFTVNETTMVTVRARRNGEWSGSRASTYVVGVPASASNLVVSEIMYHPGPPTVAEVEAGFADESDFEYLEVQNISDVPVVLDGATFSGVFDLRVAGTTIEAGGVALFVRHAAAFAFRYGPGLPVAGVYGDPTSPDGGQRLSNGGERFLLTALDGSVIRDFRYEDDESAGWPQAPDGAGASLVLKAPLTLPDHSLAQSWRSSFEGQGTPGQATDTSYHEWAGARFDAGQLADEAISGSDADPDRDGIGNLLEMAFGGDPFEASESLLPTAGFQILSDVPEPGNYLLLRAVIANQIPDLEIAAFLSDDLIDWPDAAILHKKIDLGNGFSEWIFRDSQLAGDEGHRRFVRLSVRVR